jgi:hypothetical protein
MEEVMRQIKTTTGTSVSRALAGKAAVLAAVATGIFTFGTLGASAASALPLVLKAGGTVVPLHSVAFIEMTINVKGDPSNCDFGEYNGRVESNAKIVDLVENIKPGVELNHCSPGASIKGNITKYTISNTGKLIVSTGPKLALTVPEDCTYEIGKLTATFKVPSGQAFSPSETGKGTLSATSPAWCAKLVDIEGGVAVGLNEPPRFDDFELELG